MCKFKQCSFLLLSGLVILLSSIASAGIYKCTNKKSGEIRYLDKPCAVDQKEKKLKAVKDPEGGYIPGVANSIPEGGDENIASTDKQSEENKTEQQEKSETLKSYDDYRLKLTDEQKNVMYEEEKENKRMDEEARAQQVLDNPDTSPEVLEALKIELGMNDS